MQTNPLDPSRPSTASTLSNPIFSWQNAPPPATPPAVPAGAKAIFPGQVTGPTRGPHHRRARSELAFRIPEEFDLTSADPMATGSFEEIGSEDDLFSTFMDMEKLGCKMEGSGSASECGLSRDRTAESSAGGEEWKAGNAGGGGAATTSRPKHRHSSSVDGLSTSGVTRGDGVFGEVMEAKKAMTTEQLTELAAIDPKRAKRILANRQSAARSKERKAYYISELERKVQTLQTEATTLSAQLSLYQRDTTGLTAENVELKLRLQAMEQQAQLRDALNEALKQEVERLKVATGEISSPREANNVGVQSMTYNSFFPIPQQQPSFPQQLRPPFHLSQPTAADHQLFSQSHSFADMLSQDPLGRLQGLEISKGLLQVKSESSPISASESSSRF